MTLLNLSGYLENYLWTTFKEDASDNHIISIILLINDKFADNVSSVFDGLVNDEKRFQLFFQRVVHLIDKEDLNHQEHVVSYYKFLIHFYSSLENAVVRKSGLR